MLRGIRKQGIIIGAVLKPNKLLSLQSKDCFTELGSHRLVTRSLGFLGEIERKEIDVEKLKGCARTLDRHYIPTRYVNAHVEGAPFEFYDLSTAEEAIECAARVIQFVKEMRKHE